MSVLERLKRARAAYDDGVITRGELALSVLKGIIEGNIATFDECREFIPLELRDIFLSEIEAIEGHDYVDKRTFVRDGLSDEEKRERAVRLKPVYQAIFSDIKLYFEGEI